MKTRDPTNGSAPPALAARLAFYYGAIFLVMGVYLPFWPVWLEGRGVGPGEIGLLLAITTWTKVIASPAMAQIADRLGERRRVMMALSVAALASYALFAVADGFWALALVAVLVGATLPPIMPLGENMTMLAARARGLDYGRIRLWGSLSFILASWGGGQWLAGRPESAILWLVLAGLGLTVVACWSLPDIRPTPAPPRAKPVRGLLRQPVFLLFLATVSLIQSSHGMLYGFGTLHWRAAGLSDGTIGLLWAEGVLAEVVLFAFSGRVVRRVGVVPLMLIAAAAGVARWTVTALSADLGVLLAVQLLHALTFGATHLAAMHFIQRAVPEEVSATAQGLYSAVAMGVVLASVIMASGGLYAWAGGHAFFAMTAMSVLGGVAAVALGRRWRGEELRL